MRLALDYLGDSEYLAWMGIWEERGEPALEFADWLSDRDLWLQGECVEGCLERPYKRIICKSDKARCIPSKIPSSGEYRWYFIENHRQQEFPDELRADLHDCVGKFSTINPGNFKTLPEALTALLDGYAIWKGKQ